jgi:hypothetical protein
MKRLHGEFNITLYNISSLDLGHFSDWEKLDVGSLTLDSGKLVDISAVSKLSKLRSLSLREAGAISDAQLGDLPSSLSTTVCSRLG